MRILKSKQQIMVKKNKVKTTKQERKCKIKSKRIVIDSSLSEQQQRNRNDSSPETNHNMEDLTFLLNPLDINCYKKKTIANFTPKWDKSSRQYLKAIPEFNKNGEVYNPAFIVQADYNDEIREHYKKQYHNNWQQIMKLNESKSEAQSIKEQKSNEVKYCSICKKQVKNYKRHIRLLEHKKLIVKLPAERYIKDLVCSNYGERMYRPSIDENGQFLNEDPDIQKQRYRRQLEYHKQKWEKRRHKLKFSNKAKAEMQKQDYFEKKKFHHYFQGQSESFR